MGEVWRAYDLKLRTDVALKTLLMTMTGGEEGLELLRGEVRAAREVISPNVCRLFDIIEIDGQELVSMEYIDGQTLMDLLDERCPLEIQEAGEIGSQFLAGLEAIHQAGLVHRDIKPENLMLTRSGRVVIMDFGLTAPSGTGVLAGTPAYMPPEQGRGEATDARADVFSAGMALRRALIQPARKCGYRFEDDSIVEEMLEEVTKERGALPLIAFTTARLWEERDPDSGLLTREAYDRMGGVEGALAQHAEATLETIGDERKSIVRELFRNLVTAQGTRAVMEMDEVLSVFAEERAAATEVVQTLIDARLLTTYEVRSADDEAPQRRVEIVHESLLSAWPRLVRWRIQDAESAQLRDELRQAARLWEARDRSEDLLWTGNAFLEFRLWRERYPGGLTALEESFAAAMTSFEARRGRRRRIALVTASAVVLTVLAVVGVLWQRAESARREAESARLQSDAAGLLSLGRLQLEVNPSGAVAYTLASLESLDTPEARRFAVETLWLGPTGSIAGSGISWSQIDFSPDARWLVLDASGGTLELWPRDGGEHRTLEIPSGDLDDLGGTGGGFYRIGPESDLLITTYFLGDGER